MNRFEAAEQIVIDLSDMAACKQLMKQYGDSEFSFFGVNEFGERTETGIFKDRIAVRTYQRNGWERVNILYDDWTTEEYFQR